MPVWIPNWETSLVRNKLNVSSYVKKTNKQITCTNLYQELCMRFCEFLT